MKKSIFAQLCMSLLLLLFASIVSRSQELTETQKTERCQNNFKRLEELKKQLQVVNTDISQAWTKSEIEDARTDSAYMYKWAGYYSMHDEPYKGIDEPDIRNLLAKYKVDPNRYANNSTYGQVYIRLYSNILKGLKKAYELSPKRPALIADKNNFEKQIQEHETNLIALGCVQASGDCTIPNISGKYSTDGDPRGILVFTQSGSHVTGRYGKDENSLINNLSGDFVCGTLTGTFTNTAYKVTGTFTYTFAADGSSYTGSWKNDTDGRTGPAGGHKQ